MPTLGGSEIQRRSRSSWTTVIADCWKEIVTTSAKPYYLTGVEKKYKLLILWLQQINSFNISTCCGIRTLKHCFIGHLIPNTNIAFQILLWRPPHSGTHIRQQSGSHTLQDSNRIIFLIKKRISNSLHTGYVQNKISLKHYSWIPPSLSH